MSTLRRVLPWLTATLLAVGCRPDERPLRLAIATFSHETCTFCPGGDTEIEDWTRLRPPARGAALLAEGGYIGGFVARAREYGPVALIGLESPLDVFGGSSRSCLSSAPSGSSISTSSGSNTSARASAIRCC